MEKRLGIVAIAIQDRESVPNVNRLLSEFEGLIDARMGLPMRERNVSLISLVIEGDTDAIGALTGKLGRLRGVKVKSVLVSSKEDGNDRIEGPSDMYKRPPTA